MKTAERPGPATLGEVLYADKSKSLVSEKSWNTLVKAVAAGDQLALLALYERAHRVVFTLSLRMTANRKTAEALTLDVFHDIWRRASGYDAENGTVLGWIMNQARSRAIDWLDCEQRKKQAIQPENGIRPVVEARDSQDVPEMKQQSEVMQRALMFLTADERRVIEAAFFSGLSFAEVALRLNQPLRIVKTRIRSGLHKLQQALIAEARAR